ncbi:MAG: aldehyde dehydrogenase family protein [Sphingobium sp.]
MLEDRQFSLLINGQAVAGVSAFDVVNPATGKPFASCPKADLNQLNEAVAAASRAFRSWAALSMDDRAAKLEEIAAAIETRASEFAHLLTLEQGKPIDQATGEVMGAAFFLRAFAQMRLTPNVLRDTPENRVVEHRRPLGVVAAITPWNFPLILLANKLGPALLTGNTIVIKPAPTTPLTTLLLGEILGEILPAGVANIICDEGDLGSELTSHPDIAKIAFTGSTATGKKVMASAAAMVKRVTLELGGNDCAVVLDDVDPRWAARKIYEGAMANAGQICVAIKRAYVPSSLYDAFCEEIAKLAQEAIVDDGTKQGTTVGPVQNKLQYDKVLELIEDARAQGKIIAGGEPLERNGFFIRPTIVRDLPEDARLVQEEQFGPVLPILSYDDIDDVIARANNSEFGLAGTVWGRDTVRATQVAEQIESGTVWVNHHFAIEPTIPFRGAKQSGLGGELGQSGLEEYTQAHIINVVEVV